MLSVLLISACRNIYIMLTRVGVDIEMPLGRCEIVV